jgi:hypothetical protein
MSAVHMSAVHMSAVHMSYERQMDKQCSLYWLRCLNCVNIGEGALLHPQKLRSASIRCVTPVHAIEVNREYFEKYLANQAGKTATDIEPMTAPLTI